MKLLDEAVAAGARLAPACELLGLSVRTVQRWRNAQGGIDRRQGPLRPPPNKLDDAERQTILAVVNAPAYADLSPKQIVPLLADLEIYVGSESTIYRTLRAEALIGHREPTRPPIPRPAPAEYCATGPNQVWSWDITYLRSPLRGAFYYLYLVEDLYSRKIVGWAVHETESMDHSAPLIAQVCEDEGIEPGLVLHADNGGPMKGATMLATLQRLGVVPSFSRPRVSDDNPYPESLFRTLKYRPGYPRRPFESLEEAQGWVADFVRWYNSEHLHSSLNFVTPAARHGGEDVAILAGRQRVYEAARRRNPERWSRGTRDWSPAEPTVLNPEKCRAN